MQSDFARDLADENRPIEQAAKERPGKPIRLRVQPMVLRTTAGKGQYHAWKDVRWMLECDTPEEAFATRDAMRAFFEAVSERGPHAVLAVLTAIKRKEVVA
jgi:hypothetical protein